MLRNVSKQDISVTVLGHKLSMPICVSPISFQAMAHPDGELATVRGKFTNITFCRSIRDVIMRFTVFVSVVYARHAKEHSHGEKGHRDTVRPPW